MNRFTRQALIWTPVAVIGCGPMCQWVIQGLAAPQLRHLIAIVGAGSIAGFYLDFFERRADQEGVVFFGACDKMPDLENWISGPLIAVSIAANLLAKTVGCGGTRHGERPSGVQCSMAAREKATNSLLRRTKMQRLAKAGWDQITLRLLTGMSGSQRCVWPSSS